MARIVYGLAGEGMGHAIRSKVVIEHLLKKGHQVHIVASNRACHLLNKSFADVTEIGGLTLCYENNSVKKLKSLWQNFKPGMGRESVKRVYRLLAEVKPEIIISDYEPIVAYLCGLAHWKSVFRKKKIPLLSIDNQHISSNCKVDVPNKYLDDYLVVKYLNKLIIPPRNVKEYFVTTFFHPEIKVKNTRLVPSMIREEVLKTRSRPGDNILVYQTSQSNTKMFDVLKKFKRENFVVYGFNKDKKDRNIRFRKFSEKGFIDDLASCKAAVTNGGYTMMSEAIFLHKPVFSIPVKHQWEQICNAINLQKIGYGKFQERIRYNNFSSFLYNIEEYQDTLKGYKQNDNNQALEAIDKTIKKYS